MTTPLSYPNPDPDATASAVDIGPGSSDADLKKVTAEVPSVQAAPLTVPGYTVLDRLGRGGMAEVHLAEKIGTAGVPVRCVLKTILPEHSERERFQGRFLDEARIISQLRHPNIVSTVDVGVTDDKLYLAMEWVDGTDVAQLMMSCQKRKQEIPLRHILFILREALKGLHYAHTAPGADGEPLRIIHRGHLTREPADQPAGRCEVGGLRSRAWDPSRPSGQEGSASLARSTTLPRTCSAVTARQPPRPTCSAWASASTRCSRCVPCSAAN